MTAPADGATPGPSSDVILRVVAIALGGALGTLARYAVDRAIVVTATGFPWATFTVNIAGSLLLGVIVTLVTERWPPTRYVRPFAAIGFCGGFTTFSTLMVESMYRTEHGAAGVAGLYLVASVVLGLGAAAAGVRLARLPRQRPPDRSVGIPDPDTLGTLDRPEPPRDLPGEPA